MKILHTADWHIGKIVNEFSMLEEQEYYLEQLVEKAKSLEVDVLIMAGDLYDRSIPPKEAVTLANKILLRFIQELSIPVLIIAGNHDGNERLEFGSELLANSQLYIEGMPKKEVKKLTIKGVNFYLFPYADYVKIRHLLNRNDIHNNEDALKAQVDQVMESFDPDEINVMIMHGYLINQTPESVESSDSERPLSIGTAEYVDVNIVKDFDYVALGHLHKAQKVKSEEVRYSGSPLKYSKSEVNHKKQSLIVNLTKESLDIEPIIIKPKHDMRILRGKFEELMRQESDDYIFFELEDEHFVMDAMNRLRKKYPNAMALEYVIRERAVENKQDPTQAMIEKKSVVDLFVDFYETYKGQELNDDQKEVAIKVAEDVEKEND